MADKKNGRFQMKEEHQIVVCLMQWALMVTELEKREKEDMIFTAQFAKTLSAIPTLISPFQINALAYELSGYSEGGMMSGDHDDQSVTLTYTPHGESDDAEIRLIITFTEKKRNYWDNSTRSIPEGRTGKLSWNNIKKIPRWITKFQQQLSC